MPPSMKKFLTIGVCLLYMHVAVAQSTAIYQDIDKDYRAGLELFDNKDYVNARKTFDKVLEKVRPITDPGVDVIRINSEYYRAISALELLNPDGQKLMETFLENHTDNVKSNLAHFHLGKYFYTKKRYRSTIVHMEQVETYELDFEQYVDYKFMLAYAYFYNKDFKKAKKLFAAVKGEEKYHYPAHYYHGFIAFMDGDYDAALKDFRKVEDHSYFGKVVPYYITSIYFEQKKYDQVIEYATPLLDDTKLKYFTEMNQLLGKAYFEREEYGKALPYLSYYARIKSRIDRTDLYQLAFAQYKTGDTENAIDNFQQIGQINDSLGQHALYLLAGTYLDADDKANARTAFMEASAMKFNRFISENALFNYAKLSYELGFHTTAISAMKSFLDEYPSSNKKTEANELLAEMFLTTRNYKEALETIEKMPSKSPKIREAYQSVAFYRGVEFYNNRDYSSAEEYFDKSLGYPLSNDIQAMCYFWKAEIELANNDYLQAISYYNKYNNLAGLSRGLPVEASPAAASYGMGYAYLKLEQYGSAQSSFKKAEDALSRMATNPETKSFKNSVYPDVLLRMADCQFMLKDYQAAIGNYQKVIAGKFKGQDYALFQKAMLHGLQDQYAQKIASLKRLTAEYPGSFYYDDALFHTANTYFLQNNNSQAIEGFKKLISEKPNSAYVIQSLMKLAIIYYNNNNDDQAVAYYKQVVENYPNSEEAKDALKQVKRISVETGNPDLYINMAGAGLSEQDSMRFTIAEKYYYQEKYDQAKTELDKYISQFPDGYFSVTAYYYRADCFYRKKMYSQSLDDYKNVLSRQGNTSYLEVSYLRTAKIYHYINKDFDNAFTSYEKLLEVSTVKNTTLEALKGLVFTSFETGKYNKTEQYATQLMNNEQAGKDEMIDVHYYFGKVAYFNKNYEKAMTEFTQTRELTSNEKGVEARYHIAKIHFIRNEYTLSEAACDDIIKNAPTYEYWLVKTYILVADIYIQKEEFYQAKATLESIVNNYSGDAQLLQEAKDKLDYVNDQMAQRSRIRSPGDNFFDEEDNNGGNEDE